MSTFCDIWIGNTKPTHKKRNNADWKGEDRVWKSLPNVKQPFIRDYSKDEHRLLLIGQLYEEVSDENLLQRCTAHFNGKPFKDPAGHYILIVKTVDAIHVFTNRLGTMHAYWSEQLNAISTNYKALVKTTKNKTLDWEGLTGFFAMGYFPKDSTYLESIKLFEPASYYCFDKELKLKTKRRYWNWKYEPVEKPVRESLDELQQILKRSLSEATKDYRIALPISGGLDSRMLAGHMSGHEQVKAFSYGYNSTSPELKIAKQVASAANISWHSYVMPDYLFDELDEVVEAVELFQYVDGTRQASAKDWLLQNADVVVGGHWGDVWMDDMKVSSKNELQQSFKKKIVKRGSSWLLENICKKQLRGADDVLQDCFSDFVNKYEYIQDADFIMKIYKTDQWSHRWTAASLRMYQAGAFPVLPFYDNRVVDFFTTVPRDTVADRWFQIEYIKHYYSDLAKIKWQEYDANLYNYKKFNNRNVAYRAVDKLKRTIKQEKRIQRNWEVFYLHDEGRRKLEAHLLDNELLNEYVSSTEVKKLIADLYENPNGANGYTVSMLLTFSIFLKQVFS